MSKPAKKNVFGDVIRGSGQGKAAPAETERTGNRLKSGYIQVGANIPKSLKLDVYKRLVDEESSFSALVEKLLSEWLKSKSSRH